MQILGIDIGGSGIKGAPVDLEKGEMLTERYRIPTPQPSKPRPVAKTVAKSPGISIGTDRSAADSRQSSSTGSPVQPPTSTRSGSVQMPRPCSAKPPPAL